MSIKTLSNYNPGIDISAISISEATYMLNSFIEESINDLQIKCLLADKRSLNESGVRYFTEENDIGKQKLGDKIKQIIKTVWDVIVGIFKKIRDFFKDMIEKVKEFFSKIQQKFFGKKEDKKEEPKSTEKPSEKKEESKPEDKKEETKPAEKKEENKPETKPTDKKEQKKDRKLNTGHIYSVKGDDGIYHIKQRDLILYMKKLDDKVFRESIDKNVTRYFDVGPFYEYAGELEQASDDFIDDTTRALMISRRVSDFLKNPTPILDKHKIDRNLVLDCAFGDFSIFYRETDRMFKHAEKEFGNLYKDVEKIGIDQMPHVKELLKLTTECSKRHSTAMIHNSKELMKVIQYIYKNYDQEGVPVKESVNWGSIL
nr:MAG TPA: hypothetical protein [Caudoviricetes sp.]